MIHRVKYKDTSFQISTVNLVDPFHGLHSFTAEQDIKEKWWNIKSGDVVIDVGAGQGSYTLTALAAGASVVVSYEPGREEFFDLCCNLLANGWLGNRCFTLPMMCGEAGVAAREYRPRVSFPPSGGVEWRMVLCVDELVKRMKLERVDWIKIDVEGQELRVLDGALETILKFRPTVIVEVHEGFSPGIHGLVCDMLCPLGWTEETIVKPEMENGLWSKWEFKKENCDGR